MHLKILIVPSSILIALILLIGFVKPDLDTMQEKKVVLETKLTQSRNMTTLLSNITALVQSLDTQKESENFIASYLPKTMDEERVVDMFNFLAAQAGILMVTVNFKELEDMGPKVDEVQQVVAGTPLVSGGADTVAPAVDASSKIRVKGFSADVAVKGNYENIRDFFDRAAHMNRFHKIQGFTLSLPRETGGASSPDPAGTLSGTFQADFNYFPLQKVGNALNVPVFSRAEFDTTRLNTTLSWVTSSVPALERPTSGRPNPFQ